MKRVPYLVIIVLVALSMVLSACGATPTPTEAPKPADTAVPPTAVPPTSVPPTAVPPTAIPLGSAEKPIIMALAPSATTQELLASGESIAKQLSDLTGYTITTTVPTSYAALVEAMGSGNAQIAWLPPFPYMLAKQKGYGVVGLATVRNGSDHYGSQIIANSAAGFTSYYDAATGKNTADAATALAQFKDKKPCWTDPLSSSGYIIPLGIFKNLGISVKAGAWVQGHPTVVKSIYLSAKSEICDFGATYIDARSSIAKDFPDVNDKVVIVYVTDPVIPNDNVSYSVDVPADVQAKLTEAFLKMAETEEGKAALQAVYQIQGLKAVDDTFYDDFRVYLESSGIDVSTLVK
jgi:phosphonate transport system substrate-binding protein